MAVLVVHYVIPSNSFMCSKSVEPSIEPMWAEEGGQRLLFVFMARGSSESEKHFVLVTALSTSLSIITLSRIRDEIKSRRSTSKMISPRSTAHLLCRIRVSCSHRLIDASIRCELDLHQLRHGPNSASPLINEIVEVFTALAERMRLDTFYQSSDALTRLIGGKL